MSNHLGIPALKLNISPPTVIDPNFSEWLHRQVDGGGGGGGGGGNGNGSAARCLNNSGMDVDDVDKTFQIYRIIIDVVMVGMLCLIGFVGNGLTIVILRSDRDKNSTTNWLLQSLAVVDIIYLITSVFIQPLKAIHDVVVVVPAVDEGASWSQLTAHRFRMLFAYLENYVWPLASISETVTVWIVVLVTVDRYIAICLPLRTKMRTMSRARAAVAMVTVLAVLYNAPLFFERNVSHSMPGGCSNAEFDETGNGNANAFADVGLPSSPRRLTPLRTELTQMRQNHIYFVAYKTVCYFVFRKIGPLLLLIVLNGRLVRALGEMRRRRHRYQTRRNRQRENVTLTLVVVVSVFIVCELPDVCLRVAVAIHELTDPYANDVILAYATTATNALLTLNSAVNFFIYCLIGHKFRRIMVLTLQASCGRGGGSGGRLADGHGTMNGLVTGAGGSNGSVCCGRTTGADGDGSGRRRAAGRGPDDYDDDGTSNGFGGCSVSSPPSMMTRMSIAMTTTNVIVGVGGHSTVHPVVMIR